MFHLIHLMWHILGLTVPFSMPLYAMVGGAQHLSLTYLCWGFCHTSIGRI
jgi:hypothetical protein